MELVEIKIKRFKEPVTGILLGNGTQWSLVKLNVVDYVLDGFQFTNKRYVASNCPIKEDTLQYRILAIKNSSKDISSKIDLNILEEDKLLYSFLKNVKNNNNIRFNISKQWRYNKAMETGK